jgi:peptide deformylase
MTLPKKETKLMMRYIGDPILRQKTKDVKDFDGRLQETIERMIELMHEEEGIGLAGPQVGISERLLVVDISSIEKSESPKAFINPDITASEGESIIEEGCLSIPGVREEVTRPEKITLVYQDETGQRKQDHFDGWMARVLQHEIDHLNGVLFVDYLSPLKKQLLVNQEAIPEKF